MPIPTLSHERMEPGKLELEKLKLGRLEIAQQNLTLGEISRFQSLEVPEEKELVFALYENILFHQQVVDYFSQFSKSEEITQLILEAAQKYQVSPFLAFALAWAESSYNPRAINQNSSSTDRGLFQLNNRSFPHLGEHQFFDPKVNTDQGLAYLRSCLDLGENRVAALAMYNAGRGRVRSGRTPQMTLNYIAKIIDYQSEMENSFRDHFVRKTFVTNDSNSIRYVLDTGRGSQ